MSDAPRTPFHVEQHESLPEVLERLRGHRGESLALVIPDHSPVLLTATEFRALKDLADRNQIRLSLQTQDPLRLQLASMFGLARVPTRPDIARSADDGGGDRSQFGSWRNARRPQPRTPGQPPQGAEAGTEAEPADAVAEDPIAVSRRRRNQLYSDSTPRQSPVVDDAGLDYLPDDQTEPARSRAWLIGRIVAALLVVVLVAGGVLWYFMPSVQVEVTLRRAEVSTDIVYSVAAPDATLPSDSSFSVMAEQQSAEVPFTVEIPASGVIREPDGTASGPVLFRNVGGSAAQIAEGTELVTVDGTRFLTLEAGEVAAGSVDAPGEASIPVTAAEAGSGGNRSAGAFTGRVPDSDVFYSNLNGALEGGGDRIIPVVAEEDVAAAEATVNENLASAAADGWETQLPEGQALVRPSVQPGDPTFAIEGAVGDRVRAVTVSGSVPVTGLVYDLDEVQQQSRSTFEVALQGQVPPGYRLDAQTITLGEPEVLAESPQNIDYRVSASASAVAIFEDGTADALRERMAGSDAEAARAAVAQQSEQGPFETWEISQSPTWWPERMPQTADRITIEIAPAGVPAGASPPEGGSGGGTPVTGPAGTPGGTPAGGGG